MVGGVLVESALTRIDEEAAEPRPPAIGGGARAGDEVSPLLLWFSLSLSHLSVLLTAYSVAIAPRSVARPCSDDDIGGERV
jgi:hypothetical protein